MVRGQCLMGNRQSFVKFVWTMVFHWSLVYPGFVAHVSPDHSGEFNCFD